MNWRVSDTLDLYYFPPLRTCSVNGRSDLITSDNKRPLLPNARIVRHTAAYVTDTTRYKVNGQMQVTTARTRPAPMLDTGRKIVLSLIIFFGFVFIASLILVILKLVRLTGSQ